MLTDAFEAVVQFASEGECAAYLHAARQEYLERTGEMFESDASYERRIGSFLEWYVLDRTIHELGKTPAEVYLERAAESLEESELDKVRRLLHTELSLFEYRGRTKDGIRLKNILTQKKIEIFREGGMDGVQVGDIFEARLFPEDDGYGLSDCIGFHPRPGRAAIIRVAKRFRRLRECSQAERVRLIHQVAFFSNRCQRYSHVDPRKIFADLENSQ